MILRYINNNTATNNLYYQFLFKARVIDADETVLPKKFWEFFCVHFKH